VEWWRGFLWNSFIGGIVGAIPTIGVLLSLPWTIAVLAFNARRLHDLRLSGWLQLIPIAILAVALGAFAFQHPDRPLDFTAALGTLHAFSFGAALLIYLLFYAALGLAPGTRGPNCYGEAD
jgi:uncharacterized membrane protein YhaH (DUF805 family)